MGKKIKGNEIMERTITEVKAKLQMILPNGLQP